MKQKEEEHEKRMLALNRRVRDDLPLTPAEHAAWKEWACRPLSSAGKRRKRKKRRKKKTPKASSSRCALLRFPRARAVRTWKSELIPAPCLGQSLRCPRSTGVLDDVWGITSGRMPYSARYLVRQWIQVYVSLRRLLEYFICRARRRHWQWYVLPGFAGYDTPRAVFFDVAILQVQFLDRLLCLKPVAIPQVQSLTRFTCPSLCLVLLARQRRTPVEFSQVQFLDKVFMHVIVSGAVGQKVQRVSTGAVLGQGVHARCCVWCLWPDSAEHLWSFHRCSSWTSCSCPLLCLLPMARQRRKLCIFCSCFSSPVVDIQVMVHRSLLMVLQTMVFPQLHFLYEVIDVPGMQVVQVRRCVQRHVPSTLAVHQQGRHLPFHGAEAVSHGLYCCIWWSMSLLRWLCISFVVAQRQLHMVQTACRTIDNSQLRADKEVDAPICRWFEFHVCRR